jgi:hypothetical protein
MCQALPLPSVCIFTAFPLTAVSGFRRDVDEVCALVEYYVASSGCPLEDYHSTLRSIAEERRSQLYLCTEFSVAYLTA